MDAHTKPFAIKAVIFDFDGLLMDTESTMYRSWQYEWGQWGLELETAGFFAGHGGDVTQERYDALAAAVGPGYDRDVSHRRRLEYRERLHEALDISSGLRDWIDEAEETGIRLAIASSSPRPWLKGHLCRVNMLERFDVIAAGDEARRHKPHPDVYNLALQRLRLSPDLAVAVEDTAHGVDAAHAAGLSCIAIPNPFVRPDAVRRAELVLTSAEQMRLTEALAGCRRAGGTIGEQGQVHG